MSNSYKSAGVDLEAGYESVRRIKSHIERTKTKGALGNIGAFGGFFDLSLYQYKNPVLVSGTDGVGTKLKIAMMMNKHDTIGQDVVAMCVNDVLAQGAKPLFFLDYVAVGHNNPETIEAIVKGVCDGCVLADCSLIGGETAEMPDMYEADEYDLAGFTVGAVEKDEIITSERVEVGDCLIGIASSGLHSNGFSLVRKILFKDNNIGLDEKFDELGDKTLGEVLLTPTKIYVKPVLDLIKNIHVSGIAHITGGGFYENFPRCLNKGQGLEINKDSFEVLPIFKLLQRLSNISDEEMFNVFNMGIGMGILVKEKDVERALEILRSHNETAYLMGRVTNEEGIKLI